MKIIFKGVILALFAYSAASCSYDKKEIEEPLPEATQAVCDSTDASFSADVLPLLKQKCTPCHIDGGSSGGLNFDTYEGVESVQTKILSSIKHDGDAKEMPQGGSKLSNDDILKVECWINNGAKDD